MVPEHDLLDLKALVVQARQAVAALEAAVQLQERRLAALAASSAAAATTAAALAAAAAPPTAAAANATSPDAHAAAAAAAAQALAAALQQVLRERGVAPRASRPAAPPSLGFPAHQRSAPDLGEPAPAVPGPQDEAVAAVLRGEADVPGADDWLGRHFALRGAVRLLAPTSSDAAAALDAPLHDPLAGAAAAITTCAFAFELPHPTPAAEGGGPLLFWVVGDSAGRVALLRSRDGDLLAALPVPSSLAAGHAAPDSQPGEPGAPAAVTACSAYHVRR